MLIYTGNNSGLQMSINEYNQAANRCFNLLNSPPTFGPKFSAVTSTVWRLSTIISSCSSNAEDQRWLIENIEALKNEANQIHKVMAYFKKDLPALDDELKTRYYEANEGLRKVSRTLNQLTPAPAAAPEPEPIRPERKPVYKKPSEKKASSWCCAIL